MQMFLKIFIVTVFISFHLIYGCQRQQKKEHSNRNKEPSFVKTQQHNYDEDLDIPQESMLPESPTLPSFESLDEDSYYSPMSPHEAPKWSPRAGGE